MLKRGTAEAGIVSAPVKRTVTENYGTLPDAVVEKLRAARAKPPQLEILMFNEASGYERFLIPTANLDPELLGYIMTLPREARNVANPAEYYEDEVDGTDDKKQARALCTLLGAYIESLPDEEQEELTPEFSQLKHAPLPEGYIVRTNTDLYTYCAQQESTLQTSHNIIATAMFSEFR